MVLLMNFLSCKSSNKNWSTIPNNLQNLAWRKLCNINLHISISIVSSPSIKPTNDSDSHKSSKVKQASMYNSAQQINLSSSYICLVLVVQSIFIKPIINSCFEIYMITEVSCSCSGGEELSFFRHQMGSVHFYVWSPIVLRH